MLLFTAVWTNPPLVRWLLERGVSVDNGFGSGSNTPLMQAAADGDIALINLLLDYGANIEAQNECNERPLGFACSWRQPSAVRLLLERGADPNALEDLDKSHLDWVTLSGQDEIAELLRSFGALSFSEMRSNAR